MNTWCLDFYHQSDNPKKKLQNSLNFVWRSRPLRLKGRLDRHSDGKNLEAMCSYGHDFISKCQFQFLFKQSRF